jgi:hypothetical protein
VLIEGVSYDQVKPLIDAGLQHTNSALSESACSYQLRGAAIPGNEDWVRARQSGNPLHVVARQLFARQLPDNFCVR